MPAILTILVIVPDDELRRSVAFALEAEGYGVDAHSILGPALDSPGAGTSACAVIDEEAVERHASPWEHLSGFARPVVLLVDRLRAVPKRFGMTVLTKPLLGRTLTDTVALAVGTASDVRPAT